MENSLRKLLTSKQFTRVPLHKLNTAHYKFTVQINGIDGVFILDTGASSSCIGFNAIERFKLQTQTTPIKASGAGATHMETLISEGNTLKINTITLSNISFVLFDLVHVNTALNEMNEAKVDGIIGADLLKKMRAVIDYGRNCLYLKY